MSYLSSLPLLAGDQVQGYRLVNSKFPPIALFDDVANAEDFETLFPLQFFIYRRPPKSIGS